MRGIASSRGMSWVTSWRFPLVSDTARGVPCRSVITWCLVPRRRGRPAKVRCEPPFQGPDVRAVHRSVIHVQQARPAKLRKEDLVQAGPDAGLDPVPQAPPARHPAAADPLGRHVHPGHTRAQNVDDPAQSRTVTHRQPTWRPPTPRRTRREQRSDTIPQVIRHKIIRHPQNSAAHSPTAKTQSHSHSEVIS